MSEPSTSAGISARLSPTSLVVADSTSEPDWALTRMTFALSRAKRDTARTVWVSSDVETLTVVELLLGITCAQLGYLPSIRREVSSELRPLNKIWLRPS